MSDVLDSAGAGTVAVRGSTLRVAGYAAGVGLSALSAALLFRHLGVANAGRYILVLSLVTITVGLTDAGVSLLTVRELARLERQARGPVLRSLLGLRLALSTFGVALACTYAVVAGFDDRIVFGTALAGVAVLIQGFTAVVTAELQTDLRFGALALADLIRQGSAAALVVALVLLGAGLLAFFGAQVVASICGLVAGARLLRTGRQLWPTFDRARWRSLFVKAMPFALATAVGAVYLRIGIVLLDRLSTPYQTGLYGISFRIVEALTAIVALGVGSAFPIFARAARDDDARLDQAVQRTFDVALAVGALLAVALATAAPLAVELVGGARYAAASTVLRWHSLALVGAFAAAPVGYAVLAAGHVRDVLKMTIGALVVAVALTVPLAASTGATGAAAAGAAAEWALATTGVVLMRRRIGRRLSLSAVPKVLVPSLAIASAARLVRPEVGAPTATIALVAVLFLLRVAPVDLREAVRLPQRLTSGPR